MQGDADNGAHQRKRLLPALSTVSRGLPCRYPEEKGHDCRQMVKRAHLRLDGSAPAPTMRIGLLCSSSHLPAVIKQARTHARSAAAVANAQVHQPQDAPGTHHRPDGSTPAPISLIWLPLRSRVLPEAILHTHTVSRSRRQCTGATAAGCARHSRQARRQHARPDLADLIVTQIEGPAKSNITHAHTHGQQQPSPMHRCQALTSRPAAARPH